MADTLCKRQHSKRFPGITETMRKTLLQSHRQSEQTPIIDDIMHKLNTPKKNCLSGHQSPLANRQQHGQTQFLKQEVLHNDNHRLQQPSVSRKMGDLLQPAHNGLRKILSVDKVSIRMNASRSGKGKGYNGLLGKPVAVLSKKSTGYSTQSEEEALKEENERFREMCAAEEGRLLRLEK